MKAYFLAAALGNGKLRRFVPLARGVKGIFVALHFLLVALALNFPVMFGIARLPPWEFYSRLYGDQFTAMVSEIPDPGAVTASSLDLVDEALIERFNEAMYGNGYGVKVMLPMLAFVFALVLILQIVFYLLAALFLGLYRMASSPLPFKDRFRVLVLSATLPAIGAALLGLWLPAVHLIVFYFAQIILAFALSRIYDAGEQTPELRAGSR